MIRILHVIGGLNMGGSETFLINMLKNIDTEKFEFCFLCYGNERFDYEDEVKKLGGKIIRLRKPRRYFDFGMIRLIKKVIKEYNIDVVHAHTYFNSMYGVLAARRMNLDKIIVHSHTTEPESTKSILKRIYYHISNWIINRDATIFLACGNDAGKSLFNCRNEFEIIKNGISIDKYKYSLKIRNKKRRELKISDTTTALFHVGRFEEPKNHGFLIEIFKKFHDKHQESKLFLVGDGSLRSQITKKAKALKLEDDVIFLGKRKDVNELYSAMDVLVFPSLYEGSPVTLIEAQASGIPIVASANIDNEINSSGTIKFLPLEVGTGLWTDAIENQITMRIAKISNVFKKKYDAKNSALRLECIYGGNLPLARGPKVSIIIPAYNASGQIKRCLDSIIGQSYENLDIIVVDDGSTDGTCEVVRNCAKNDGRIYLLKGNHRGPSLARYAGVKAAKGEYVMFVDADDYINKDAVSKVVSCFEKNDVDVIRFNAERADTARIMLSILTKKDKEKVIFKPDIMKLLYTTYNLNSLCSQAYKMSLVKNPKAFDNSLRFGEDFLANLIIHENTNKMLLINDVLYCYCHSPESTTRSENIEQIKSNINDRIIVSKKAIEYADKNYAFNDDMKREVAFRQAEMICDVLMGIARLKKYNKDNFMMDFGDIFSKNIIQDVDVERMKDHFKAKNIVYKLKYYKLIKAVLNSNYNAIWHIIVARRFLKHMG